MWSGRSARALVIAVAVATWGCGGEGGEGGEGAGGEGAGGEGAGDATSPADGVGAACETDEECPGERCDLALGQCVCVDGATRCEAGGVATCADGTYGAPVGCDDGDPCTDDPGCEAGACPPPVPVACDDGDPCTIGFCAPAQGGCAYAPSGEEGCCASAADCDDGLACTEPTCTDAGACAIAGGPCADEATVDVGGKGAGAGELDGPRGVVALADGRIVVSDTMNARLAVFAADGTWDRAWLTGSLASPSGLTRLSDGRVAVADTGNDRVAVVDPSSGELVESWDGGGALQGPADVAAVPAAAGGGVWVANTGASNLVRLGPGGQVEQTLSQAGDALGRLRSPRGLWLSPDGRLWVADSQQQRITVFDPQAEAHVLVFGQDGADPLQFKFPAGVAGIPGGWVAIADPGNRRVQFVRTCTPQCGDGAGCGPNGCGGTCGQCFGDGATCEGGQCAGDVLGGLGCRPREAGGAEVPTCDGCACEECVCAADDYCCDVGWDGQCVGICVQSCGAVCAGGEPQLDMTASFASALESGLSPTQLTLSPTGVLWVVDNVQSRLRGYPLSP